jgi:hypothetical protein
MFFVLCGAVYSITLLYFSLFIFATQGIAFFVPRAAIAFWCCRCGFGQVVSVCLWRYVPTFGSLRTHWFLIFFLLVSTLGTVDNSVLPQPAVHPIGSGVDPYVNADAPASHSGLRLRSGQSSASSASSGSSAYTASAAESISSAARQCANTRSVGVLACLGRWSWLILLGHGLLVPVFLLPSVWYAFTVLTLSFVVLP